MLQRLEQGALKGMRASDRRKGGWFNRTAQHLPADHGPLPISLVGSQIPMDTTGLATWHAAFPGNLGIDCIGGVTWVVMRGIPRVGANRQGVDMEHYALLSVSPGSHQYLQDK